MDASRRARRTRLSFASYLVLREHTELRWNLVAANGGNDDCADAVDTVDVTILLIRTL